MGSFFPPVDRRVSVVTLLAAGFVLLAQLLPGLWLSTLVARRTGLGPAGFLALWPLLGLTILSVVTLVAGHLAVLGPWLLWGLVGAGAILVGLDRAPIGLALMTARAGVLRQWQAAPISVTAVVLGMTLAVVASFAPPSRTDEVEYHSENPLGHVAQEQGALR